MRGWMRHPRVFERIAAVGSGAYARGLAREMQSFDPDVVISTYNLAGQLLGRLRRRGKLRTPVAAYVTDAGAHPYWVASGADLHLAPLAATATALEALGATNVAVVDPLVAEPTSLTRAQARQHLGVPPDESVVLVNGGSWGVGGIVSAARSAASTGARVHVVCGNSDKLAASVSRLRDCHAIGWTDAMPAWVRAVDVVVDSAGGTTCWEAIVAGTPVVVHRPLAGHGRLNAATLRRAGLASVSWTERDLVHALARMDHRHGRDVADGINAADAVLAAA